MVSDKLVAGLFLSLAAATAFAFQPIPKESAKALGMTRGKPFVAGVVFINGKFIDPPYTVERWGTGIRINQTPVSIRIGTRIVYIRPQCCQPELVFPVCRLQLQIV